MRDKTAHRHGIDRFEAIAEYGAEELHVLRCSDHSPGSMEDFSIFGDLTVRALDVMVGALYFCNEFDVAAGADHFKVGMQTVARTAMAR